jgi:hypothetical protein
MGWVPICFCLIAFEETGKVSKMQQYFCRIRKISQIENMMAQFQAGGCGSHLACARRHETVTSPL